MMMRCTTEIYGCASHSNATTPDVKELFRKEIMKWKDEDPLFMAYVYGQEAGRKEGFIKDPLEYLERRKRIQSIINEIVSASHSMGYYSEGSEDHQNAKNELQKLINILLDNYKIQEEEK